MTSSTPKAPVETKVTAATLATGLAGVVLALLTWLQDNPGLISALPDTYEGMLWLLVPVLITFISGWLAPHTPRSVSDPYRG